jgi:gliding motility-associated-like protein
MTITVNPLVTPTFTQVAPICSGATLNALPLVSTNLINGTWSPALNNTTTTQYTFTPNTGECAISTTMTITVNPLVTPSFTQVTPICSGETLAALPLVSTNLINGTWSPAIDNMSTTQYTFTPNTGECATSTTMTITVNPLVTPTFTQVAPICSGASLTALPLTSTNLINGTWSPALNNTTTTQYTFTPNTGECATSTTMTITVNPLVTPTFTQVAPICSGTTLAALPLVSTNLINGTWSPAIDNTATTEYTFTPSAGQCLVTTTMIIVVENRVIPQFNAISPICFGASLDALPTISNDGFEGVWSPAINPALTTTYTFTPLTSQCAYERTLTIEVNQLTLPVFNPVSPICSGSTILDLPLQSVNSIQGTWFPSINTTQTTTYLFTPLNNECATTTTLQIEVLPNTIVPQFNAISPICEGTQLNNLNPVSNNGISGVWSPALNNLVTTTYFFTPNVAQCALPTQLVIEVNQKVTPIFNSLAPICEGQTITPLSTQSVNGIIGVWSPALNNNLTTNYLFTPNTNECALPTQLILTVHPNPIVKLAGGTICKDLDTNTITKGHILSTNFDPYAYSINWNYENVFINGIYTNTYNAMAIGDYFVKVTDNSTGCFSVSNTVSVVEKEYSTLFTTEVTDFFSESPSVLVLSSNSENDFWYQLDSGLPQSANQFINVSHGLHEITVFDNEGCLYEKIEARIFSYPKYFTPNADGINDFWHVFDANLLPNISLFLYDRYGKFITKLTSNSIGWDGTYLGNKLPSDDYWFVIYYDENGISKTHRSHFSLKR